MNEDGELEATIDCDCDDDGSSRWIEQSRLGVRVRVGRITKGRARNRNGKQDKTFWSTSEAEKKDRVLGILAHTGQQPCGESGKSLRCLWHSAVLLTLNSDSIIDLFPLYHRAARWLHYSFPSIARLEYRAKMQCVIDCVVGSGVPVVPQDKEKSLLCGPCCPNRSADSVYRIDLRYYRGWTSRERRSWRVETFASNEESERRLLRHSAVDMLVGIGECQANTAASFSSSW
ncbi:uncharacterized protein IWZ02DRAFT_12968 [Phyllosticta citriasiana]|uniref:Uncharacterized protein n=1 Tax=Phyllosticta citriasiana TaxID=595635 RepID=A0ABR1KHK6_9PEZI